MENKRSKNSKSKHVSQEVLETQIRSNEYALLRKACSTGQLNDVMQLVRIQLYNDYLLRDAYGHLNVVQWIIESTALSLRSNVGLSCVNHWLVRIIEVIYT